MSCMHGLKEEVFSLMNGHASRGREERLNGWEASRSFRMFITIIRRHSSAFPHLSIGVFAVKIGYEPKIKNTNFGKRPLFSNVSLSKQILHSYEVKFVTIIVSKFRLRNDQYLAPKFAPQRYNSRACS